MPSRGLWWSGRSGKMASIRTSTTTPTVPTPRRRKPLSDGKARHPRGPCRPLVRRYFKGSWSPLAEDLLYRAQWVARPSRARRNSNLDLADRSHLHHETLWSSSLSDAGHPDRDADAAYQHATAGAQSWTHDAGATTNSSRGPGRPHQLGAARQRGLPRRKTPTIRNMARRHLRTPTVLTGATR